jgi:tetrapyrrole methylase family protein/MazG family protein/ATP diphosphatase
MPSNEARPPSDSLLAQAGATLPRLAEIMRRLLAPDGCPWDKEQTLQTLRPFVIEEAYEVLDAIDSGKPDELREELGDLLMQIVFQAALTARAGWFGLDDVVAGISEKLVRRHPHVFGETQVSGTDEVLANWEKLKAAEKKDRGLLDSLPKSLPALLRAVRIGEKAARVGYDWADLSGVRAKVDEELAELDVALAGDDAARAEEELGDVLFALASLARKRGLDPEGALRGTLDRFTTRVQAAEALARAQGTTLPELDDAARDALWERVKRGD